MNALVETSQESTNNTVYATSAAEVKPPLLSFQAIGLLFACALILRLWFNFATDHVNCYGVSDASEYLRYATAISKLNFSAPVFGPEWKEFAISGPAFPFFLYLCAKLTMSPFNPANSDLFLCAQSLCSAITAVFIASCASRLWTPRIGLVSGYLAAFYPAFIVNSGRLYSETFATFLEMAALTILIRLIFKKSASTAFCLILGALLALLQLTRSSMILFSFTSLLAVGLIFLEGKRSNNKSALRALAATTIGIAVVLSPWFIFQKAAFNKISPVVDRVGNYNLFIGANSDIQGFLTYPYPDGRGIEKKTFATLIYEAYKKSPSRFLKLAMDKPARLYKFPWNDFRISIGPFDFHWQVLFHQNIILLSLCGLCLALTVGTIKNGKSWSSPQLWGRFLLLTIFALNLPYLAFITVPRYNLLAMPALIIFAAAGILTLIELLQREQLAKEPKAILLAALISLIYLRDDLRTAFALGSAETASLYIVQGNDLLVRGIACSACVFAFFAAIFVTINMLEGKKLWARIVTLTLGAAAVLLCFASQRANGRAGEGIITLARPGEKLVGQIAVAQSAVAKLNDDSQWFLLVDSDQGQLLKNQYSINIAGQKVAQAPLAGISALDDWNYLKTPQSGNCYLECSYIFDCLSGPASMSNSEIRQWFAIPLENRQLAQIARDGRLDVIIEQKSKEPSKFFSAAPAGKNKKGIAENLLPARKLYSWEKAFYGVENDEGLTDARLDEKLPARAARWSIAYEGTSEDLPALDLNVRLIKVKNDKLNINSSAVAPAPLQVTATGEAVLSLSPELLSARQQLLTVHVEAKKDKDSGPVHATSLSLTAGAAVTPQLYLTWSNGGNHKMPLPGVLQLAAGHTLNQSFLTDLSKTEATDCQLHCLYPVNSSEITLQASALQCHPFYSEQEIF